MTIQLIPLNCMQIYVRHNSPIQQHVTKCLPQNIGLEEIYTDQMCACVYIVIHVKNFISLQSKLMMNVFLVYLCMSCFISHFLISFIKFHFVGIS